MQLTHRSISRLIPMIKFLFSSFLRKVAGKDRETKRIKNGNVSYCFVLFFHTFVVGTMLCSIEAETTC